MWTQKQRPSYKNQKYKKNEKLNPEIQKNEIQDPVNTNN